MTTDQDHAKIVREALMSLSEDKEFDFSSRVAVRAMAIRADNATLAKLRRMLR